MLGAFLRLPEGEGRGERKRGFASLADAMASRALMISVNNINSVLLNRTRHALARPWFHAYQTGFASKETCSELPSFMRIEMLVARNLCQDNETGG
jgi:hypothetical protein